MLPVLGFRLTVLSLSNETLNFSSQQSSQQGGGRFLIGKRKMRNSRAPLFFPSLSSPVSTGLRGSFLASVGLVTSGRPAPRWRLAGRRSTGRRIVGRSVLPGLVLEGLVLEGLVLEGLVLEGPVLEGPVPEGPVLEGPVLEGLVLEGLVLEGPLVDGLVLGVSSLGTSGDARVGFPSSNVERRVSPGRSEYS